MTKHRHLPCNSLTCSIPEAGRLFGLRSWASYEAVRRGYIPTIKMGKSRMRVPISAIADQLGVSREEVTAEIVSLAKTGRID